MNGFFHVCIRASCRKREMLLKEVNNLYLKKIEKDN